MSQLHGHSSRFRPCWRVATATPCARRTTPRLLASLPPRLRRTRADGEDEVLSVAAVDDPRGSGRGLPQRPSRPAQALPALVDGGHGAALAFLSIGSDGG